MIEFLLQIGPIGIPIFIASVLGVAVFLERLYSLRADKIIPKQICLVLENSLQKKELESVFVLASADEHMLGSMIHLIQVQREKGRNREQIANRLEEWATQQAAHLERGLEVLSIVASVAPLFGLLGTVLGMVVTFEAIQQHGLGNIDGLAGGISQALLTTVAGLSAGIPALIAHRYLQAKVDNLLLELERIATEILDAIDAQRKDVSLSNEEQA